MKKYTLIMLLTFLMVLLLANCGNITGNKLTREKARDIIIKHYQFPITNHSEGVVRIGEYQGLFPPSTNPFIKLKQLGLINFEKISGWGRYTLTLTDAGLNYVYGKKPINKITPNEKFPDLIKLEEVSIITGKTEFIEVSGISMSNDGKTATVKFVVDTKLTPFGEFFRPPFLGQEKTTGKQEKTIELRLWDDGWKVEENSRGRAFPGTPN